MKFHNVSVKWKLAAYLVIFLCLMLCVLYLLQIVFLEDFYEYIKKRELESFASAVQANLDGELAAVVEQVSWSGDVCARVVDSAGRDLCPSPEVRFSCVIHNLGPSELSGLFDAAEGGPVVKTVNLKPPEPPSHMARSPLGRGSFPMKNLIYISTARLEDGSRVLVMLNTVITPVSATVETLSAQFIFISALFLALSVLLALTLSRKISKPLISLNASAKKLALGRWDSPFEGSGYREVCELRDTLNYAAGELSKVEALRRELIANISHDFRTPLTMITGYAEIMRDIPGENTPGNVQIIIDEAERLKALVTDAMDMSKLKTGVERLNVSRFNLTRSVEGIVNRYAKMKEREGYAISFMRDGEARVEADEVKICQVVYNLIGNAVHFTGEDKRVTVTQSVSNAKARIEVADTGAGIDDKDQKLIWDRYSSGKKGGVGLGLAIAKSILELHGAPYGVISAPGKGSVFWFELKLCD